MLSVQYQNDDLKNNPTIAPAKKQGRAVPKVAIMNALNFCPTTTPHLFDGLPSIESMQFSLSMIFLIVNSFMFLTYYYISLLQYLVLVELRGYKCLGDYAEIESMNGN